MKPTKEMIETGSRIVTTYPEKDPGARPWDRHPSFNSHARNKLSMTVDLTRSEGKEVFKKLVMASDVVIENNSAGVMEKLGLAYPVLLAAGGELPVSFCGTDLAPR